MTQLCLSSRGWRTSDTTKTLNKTLEQQWIPPKTDSMPGCRAGCSVFLHGGAPVPGDLVVLRHILGQDGALAPGEDADRP